MRLRVPRLLGSIVEVGFECQETDRPLEEAIPADAWLSHIVKSNNTLFCLETTRLVLSLTTGLSITRHLTRPDRDTAELFLLLQALSTLRRRLFSEALHL